jgi:hypothetical protein
MHVHKDQLVLIRRLRRQPDRFRSVECERYVNAGIFQQRRDDLAVDVYVFRSKDMLPFENAVYAMYIHRCILRCIWRRFFRIV